jgi:hypothetical protein
MPRTNLASDEVMSALSYFIKLRREGWSRDDAWYKTLDDVNLPQGDEAELLFLAKKWEQREGNKHLQESTGADSTLVRPPQGLAQAVAASQNAQAAPRPAAQHTTMLNAQALQHYEDILRDRKPIGAEDTNPLLPAAPAAPAENLPAQLAPALQVVIYFRDFPDVLRLSVPVGKEVIVGRATPNSPMVPDIDLNPFRGAEMGVSRMHATLERRNNSLLLVDLGSRNFTFVNGEQMPPHDVRVLKSGDQIAFGRLLTQFNFR